MTPDILAAQLTKLVVHDRCDNDAQIMRYQRLHKAIFELRRLPAEARHASGIASLIDLAPAETKVFADLVDKAGARQASNLLFAAIADDLALDARASFRHIKL